jgi:hypothetical protein
MKDNHVSLPGSFREPLAQAQVLGPGRCEHNDRGHDRPPAQG